MPSAAGAQLLVVDDDAREVTEILQALRAAGYGVSHHADSLEALIAVEREHPAGIVLDWEIGLIDGAIFLRALRAGLPHPPPVIVLTDSSVDPAGVPSAGAGAWLARPLDTMALVRAVRELVGGP